MARTKINRNMLDTNSIRLFNYRRPVLEFVSTTTVDAENNVTSDPNMREIIFPDGEIRQTSNQTYYRFNITRNAVLSGSKQSGLRTSLSEAVNTWYAIYAVKVTDSDDFVLVGDTTLPIRSNFATLNTNLGTDSWIYLGLIRNGDGDSATGDILNFSQTGNKIKFKNGTAFSRPGLQLASATANTVSYTYAAGTGATDIPNNIVEAVYAWYSPGAAARCDITDTNSNRFYFLQNQNSSDQGGSVEVSASEGLSVATGASSAKRIWIRGFTDNVLGVGPNPVI